jgi:hypothetical protein
MCCTCAHQAFAAGAEPQRSWRRVRTPAFGPAQLDYCRSLCAAMPSAAAPSARDLAGLPWPRKHNVADFAEPIDISDERSKLMQKRQRCAERSCRHAVPLATRLLMVQVWWTPAPTTPLRPQRLSNLANVALLGVVKLSALRTGLSSRY